MQRCAGFHVIGLNGEPGAPARASREAGIFDGFVFRAIALAPHGASGYLLRVGLAAQKNPGVHLGQRVGDRT